MIRLKFSVALWYNPDTRLYFNITSPSGVLYQIWDDWPSGEWYNNSLPDAHVHKYFPFGTVGAGDYIIDFPFEQEPAHVNIAMVISYFEPASTNVNSSDTTNSTTPPPDNSTTGTTPPPISPTVIYSIL
ncbi:MAG: hypothetical protein GF311_07160 [Candidatus Lokiarchaeota archaeon]|nr:hypothetical protein [Candidatus Lokiarchaeota archaeon]